LKAKIIKLIEQNYSDPNFDVNKLAELLGVCRNYLNTRFQFEFDKTPHHYIRSIRIEKAKELLKNNLAIVQICKKTGYANKKTFYNAFKKQSNMTPKEYRNRIRK
jgi:AraC-like DNA-binding protein